MMKVAWVWRHHQTIDYMLNTQDARFETIAYLARQNHVLAIAPGDFDYQMARSSWPISGQFTIAGVAAPYDRLLTALAQWVPEVVVCEGGFQEAEWMAIRQACPSAFTVLYYGGGPFWNADGQPFPMAREWEAIFVPHEAQRAWLLAQGIKPVLRAWGVPTNVFRPLGIPKQYHVYYPANFAPGKRNALVAQYLEQYAPAHLPSLFTGRIENPNVLDMVRVGGVPMNNPGPPRGQARLGDRVPQVLMPLIYNAAEVLVYGSQEEGHPNAVFEAMACGTPAVVMSDCEWMVADACRALSAYRPGIVVADPHPDAIHQAVEEIMAQYEYAQQAARAAIVDRYDWWPMYLAIDQTIRNGLALKQTGKPLTDVL